MWLVEDTSIALLINFIYMDRAGMKQVVISWLPIRKVSFILYIFLCYLCVVKELIEIALGKGDIKKDK